MMSEREILRDWVIEQIKKDVDAGDFTAIYEMLMGVPDETLIAYLPEESQ